MPPIRIVAIRTAIAEAVRANLKAPDTDFPRTPSWPPTTHHVVTACTRSTLRKTAESYLLTIDSTASNRCHNRAPFTSTPIPAPALPKTTDSPKNCAEVPALSMRMRMAVAPRSGIHSRRRIRAGNRKTFFLSRSRLLASKQHYRRLFHLPYRARIGSMRNATEIR
jgi:hypothetical protein